jgi:regulatory protein
MKNNELLQTAFYILSRRAYSERELRQKLSKKYCDKDQIDEVVCYLYERGYLNDTALCNMLIRKYINCGKYGKRAIINKISQRGIANGMIREAMAAYNFDELSEAISLIEKLLNKSCMQLDKIKIGRFLINRGFDYSTIMQAFEHFK